ncbi:hypothetical protein MKZ38_000022 [Zalerion maritima]|uniref:RING-type domain-containing protein n=1 Tax=Zalerion maritima TaxID=339359 RepID=A0AAD5RRX9_9PEZI|nr:hypothetical protein MKZ38_000022 [Zalerion maritima]
MDGSRQQPDLAYSETINYNITTISSRYAETDNGVIQGFLYVPALQSTDYCYEWAQENIPTNVTHRTDLPPTDLRRIAIAPWVDIECTQDYLSAARNEGIRAMLFYRPGGGTNSKPRSGNDIIWALDDSFLWKEQNRFPVYALPSLLGEEIVNHLADYNGDVSSVPNGSEISEVYQPNDGDYIRIWTEITVSTESDIPQVWVFALAILAIIGGVILLTSGGMHGIHYRRRRALRRRVENGKVDLEALGIKKIPVPRWATKDQKRWPLLKYSPLDPPDGTQPPLSPMSSVFSGTTAGLSREAHRALFPTDHQPRCEICTRYFVNMSTLIKEAPCGHIFHPECIDEYTTKSSLCPLCKTCLLPKGWSPKISNAMVRRERSIRKCREVIEVDPDEECNGRPRRVETLFSRAPSPRSSNADLSGSQNQSRDTLSGVRQIPRALQNRPMWSRTSVRRTPPLNQLPTVSETESQHLPALPPSPASSQMPISRTPDTLTNLPSRPPSQPSPIPFPPQPAVTTNSQGDRAIQIEPVDEHPATELERIRPSPSSSTRRRRIRHFLGPDLEEESPKHPGMSKEIGLFNAVNPELTKSLLI